MWRCKTGGPDALTSSYQVVMSHRSLAALKAIMSNYLKAVTGKRKKFKLPANVRQIACQGVTHRLPRGHRLFLSCCSCGLNLAVAVAGLCGVTIATVKHVHALPPYTTHNK